MKYNQPRLILTPKVPSSLGVVPLRPEIAKLVDPNSEFDLLDIRLELEQIEAQNASKYGSPICSRDPDTPALPVASRFGGNVSEVANFGRGGFRMQLSDSELSSDADDDENDAESFKENATVPVAPEEVRHSPIGQRIASPSGRTDANWWNSSGREASPLLPKADEAETALREINREILLKVKEEIKQTHLRFEEQFNQEQRRAAERFTQLEREEAVRRERARRTDKQDHRMIAEARDLHLSALQRDHEQRTQVEERAIRKEVEAEEARKRELERLERQREQHRRAREEAEGVARRKAEAEREKAAKDAADRKAKADAAAAAANQRAALRQAEKQEVKEEVQQAPKGSANEETAKIVASATPKPRISEEAAREEKARLTKLKEMQDSYKQTLANPALKKELKGYEKQIIKHLQQVSATQEQVRKKSTDLIQLFQTPNGPPVQYLAVTLGAKLLSQCESQVQKLPSFAFALAQVVATVASKVPFVMDSVLAQLHQACIFTVPKYYVFSKSRFENDEAYYKLLGYREEGGKLESTDDYILRMNAYVTFYAALTQTEALGGRNPHGLDKGWEWCSRLLNRVPANRETASALEAFLKTAGFRLYEAYPKPFMKLLEAVVSEFLESLKNTSDSDATAVVYRLDTYFRRRQFLDPPEGRNMSRKDISSQLRA